MWNVGDIIYRVGIAQLVIIPYRVLNINYNIIEGSVFLSLENCFTGTRMGTYLPVDKSDKDTDFSCYTIDINRAYKWQEEHTKQCLLGTVADCTWLVIRILRNTLVRIRQEAQRI